MLSLVACCLALQTPSEEPPRLRTLLSNGAVVLVQREPAAKQLTLSLFVSSRTANEQPATHGLRHLLEHLEARGRDGDIDQKLESQGAFLTAETLRDTSVFTIVTRPSDLTLGLESMADVMALGTVTHENIVHEAAIIRQEQALAEVPARLSQAAWRAAYGDEGLDPSGDPDVIEHASPEQIADLHRRLFVGPDLVLVISGNVDVEGTTKRAANLLSTATPAKVADLAMRTGHGGQATTTGGGEAVAALVSDFNSLATAASLAAACGIASEVDDSFLTYTPSERGGLIIVGSTGHVPDLAGKVQAIDAASIFAIGRSLARRWVEVQIGPENDGFLRGLLLVQGAGIRPETMLQNLDSMSVDDFKAALDGFKGTRAVTVSGE